MKTTRIISVLLFYFVRIISFFYLATTIHIVLSTIFKLSSLKFLENNRFAVCYPFTEKHFILGSEYTFSYITEMITILTFYSIFFYLLSNVFKTFKQTKLFTYQGVLNLKRFYIINLIIAPLFLIIVSINSGEDYPYFAIIAAHCIIGIFAFFIASIFQQGVNLQTDQDLII